METTYTSAELAGVPPAVIERSRRLLEEIAARPKDAPVSDLGREMEAIRQKYIDEGGELLSGEDFDREVRRYRFGIED